jgi:hypothetical protein
MRALTAILAAAVIAPTWHAAADEPPSVGYWHVWTDADGISHQSRCELRNFVMKSMEPPESPEWQDPMDANGATVIVTVLPVGWQGLWHENPKPKWIVPLSGRWFVQTMDGRRIEMGPGDISFGEDQNTRLDAEGRKGHLSGTVGEAPAVLLVVHMASAPTVNQPCRLK